MDSGSLLQNSLGAEIGVWVGFVLTLMVFSTMIGDTILARLAQYILVGATLGYLTRLTAIEILWQRLLVHLVLTPGDDLWRLIPLSLILLLVLAWGSQISFMGNGGTPSGWRCWVQRVGLLPVGLMLGMGIATGIAGAIQGTLLPQFWRAVNIGVPWQAPGSIFVAGVLTLLTTTGAMLHLYGAPQQWASDQRFALLVMVTRVWSWFGTRVLWLAAGVIFARLLASRITLFTARIEYLRNTLEATGVWEMVAAIARSL